MKNYQFAMDLCQLFGNRIGLALYRNHIDFSILYCWYMEGQFYDNTKKLKGIGPVSRYIIFQYFLQHYRKKPIEVK